MSAAAAVATTTTAPVEYISAVPSNANMFQDSLVEAGLAKPYNMFFKNYIVYKSLDASNEIIIRQFSSESVTTIRVTLRDLRKWYQRRVRYTDTGFALGEFLAMEILTAGWSTDTTDNSISPRLAEVVPTINAVNAEWVVINVKWHGEMMSTLIPTADRRLPALMALEGENLNTWFLGKADQFNNTEQLAVPTPSSELTQQVASVDLND